MKAVILEVKNGDAAALKDDGTVVKIKDENYKVGDVIRMKEKKPLFNKKWGTLVAALLIFAMVGTSTWVSAEPYYFVDFNSVDDEITFEVDSRDRVINADFENSFSRAELEALDIIGMKIDKAILEVIETLKINVDEEKFLITTAPKEDDDREKAERLAAKILKVLEETTVEKGDDDQLEVEAIGAQMVEKAREVGISPGKVNIVEKLFEGNDRGIEIGDRTFRTSGAYLDFIKGYTDDKDATPEEIKENTKALMKDLMRAYSESKGEKNGVKFQEELDDEDFEDKDLNKDGKVNGKDTAPGQNELKPDDDPDDSLKPEKEKSNNGNAKGNGNN